MVRTNPIPEGLRDRPFSEQAEALPAREALRAVLATAPGFRDETPDPVAFATGLLPLANAIFRGDMPLEVNLNQFSQGEQMEYVGQAVHQLVRENYLQRTVFQDFGQTLLEVTKAVQSRAAAMKMELSICDEERAPDPVVGDFRVNDKELNAPVTAAQVQSMLTTRDEQQEASRKRDREEAEALRKQDIEVAEASRKRDFEELMRGQQQMAATLAALGARLPPVAAPAPAQPAAALALAGGAQLPQQGVQPGAGAMAPAAAPAPPQQVPPLVGDAVRPQRPPPPLERPEGGAPLSAEATAFVPGGLQRDQQAAAPAPGPAPASPARLQQQVFDPPASPGLELAKTVYADINGKWREVNVLCHHRGMICVAWIGGESQQRQSMELPRSKVRTLEEHNSLKGRFLIGQFPVLMRFFGAAGEVEQHQYIRMLASGVKSVAGEVYDIGVKAAAVERAIASIGMNEEMISEMFASGPQAPQHAVFGHVTAKLAEAIRASQQSGDSLVKIADASTKVANLGTQVWESATTGSGAAYSKHLLGSTNEPGARTARVLVDMSAKVQGAEDFFLTSAHPPQCEAASL
jgi:hypothetical protein